MTSAQIERRLAAILSADVVAYSRLMSLDEEGTLARLKAIRREIIDPAVAQNRGRLVKLTGDGALIEFGSAVDAVRCAVTVQDAVAERTRDEPADRRIIFRVGINVGDVMIDGDDLYGDGVNVAARLQALADSGGVLISGNVHDHVVGRMPYRLDALGEQRLKNIDRPIRVYRVVTDQKSASAAKPSPEADGQKPSIVVLPFTNMSGEADQEFFVDGLTEDIITELSRFRHLFVISRNSAFVYKGRSVNIREVARDLAVQYVLEGSVRKAGPRVRVTVQLIDAESDRHIWAERYDRELQDIFAIQDELTMAIAATLSGRVEDATFERAQRKPTENLVAYENVLAAKRLHHRSERAANTQAQRLITRAVELDPNYAHAHAWRGCILGQAWVYGWCADRDAAFVEVVSELNTALALDPNDSDVHRILAAINLTRHDYDQAVYHQERALALNPNDDLIVVQQGELLTWMGRPDEGAEWIKKAMRLNPYHPERFWNHLGRAYFTAHRYADALSALKRVTAPDHTHHAFLAACYARLGDDDAARGHAAEVIRRSPDFTIAAHVGTLHYKDESDTAHFRDALRQARLPENA